ncbi:hypothetical protein C8Q79DRAFT_1015207 [Trametes meyenii]|nr:hypothetical protein C8Q79DRAFT_1015207 [Trametes meyenii]
MDAVAVVPTLPTYPYQDPTAGDLIIRSCDGFDLHIDRARVAHASPVFSSMLSLPQPRSEKGPGAKPIVEVSEKKKVWQQLLPFLCVDEELQRDLSLDDFGKILKIVEKYELRRALLATLVHFISVNAVEEEPYLAYALACAHGLQDLAQRAARRTLALPIYPTETDAPAFALLSGAASYQLLQYRKRCAAALRTRLQPPQAGVPYPWISKEIADGISNTKGCTAFSCPPSALIDTFTLTWNSKRKPIQVKIRASWVKYLEDLVKALEYNPQGATARSLTLLKPVVQSVLKCPNCAEKIYAEAEVFSQKVEKEIEEVIAGVRLTFAA